MTLDEAMQRFTDVLHRMRSDTANISTDDMATAALSALEDAGWVVVPVALTPEMRNAMHDAYYNETGAGFFDGYRAAVAARPRTQERGEG